MPRNLCFEYMHGLLAYYKKFLDFRKIPIVRNGRGHCDFPQGLEFSNFFLRYYRPIRGNWRRKTFGWKPLVSRLNPIFPLLCLHKLNLYCSEAVFTGGANFVWSNLFKSSYDLFRTWSGQLMDFNSFYPSLPTDDNKYIRFNLSTA